jgi:hypothetical protein
MFIMFTGNRQQRRAAFAAAALVSVLLPSAACSDDLSQQEVAPDQVSTRATRASIEDAYLWFTDIDTSSEPNVVMVNGVPRVRYSHLKEPQANPVTVTQWGLEQHAKGHDEGSSPG